MRGKGKGSFALLVTAIIILVVAYGVFMGITQSMDGTNSHNNLTASTTNTVYGIVPLVLVIAAIVAFIGICNFYISSGERFRRINARFRWILDFLDTTTYYFTYGLFAYAIFGTVGGGAYLSYRIFTMPGAGGVSLEIGKWILIIIAFFFVTALVGYLFERYPWRKWKERKRESQAINDLPQVGIE